MEKVRWECSKEFTNNYTPGEQSLCFLRVLDSGWHSKIGHCLGSTSPALSTPACACPRSEISTVVILILSSNLSIFGTTSGFVQASPFCNPDHEEHRTGFLPSHRWTPSSTESFWRNYLCKSDYLTLEKSHWKYVQLFRLGYFISPQVSTHCNEVFWSICY